MPPSGRSPRARGRPVEQLLRLRWQHRARRMRARGQTGSGGGVREDVRPPMMRYGTLPARAGQTSAQAPRGIGDPTSGSLPAAPVRASGCVDHQSGRRGRRRRSPRARRRQTDADTLAGDQTEVRGEYGAAASGRSPRARGRRRRRGRRRLDDGTLPARAGQTRSRSTWRCASEDAPRARGADRDTRDNGVYVAGRSPRAGQTRSRSTWRCASGDAPRARGADLPPDHLRRVDEGRSPARAGQTAAPSPRRDGSKTLPRARGADAVE